MISERDKNGSRRGNVDTQDFHGISGFPDAALSSGRCPVWQLNPLHSPLPPISPQTTVHAGFFAQLMEFVYNTHFENPKT